MEQLLHFFFICIFIFSLSILVIEETFDEKGENPMKHTKKPILFSLVLALSITMVSSAFLGEKMQSIQDNVLRLHVVANSDSAKDQELKLKVRDAVSAACASYFSPATTKEESEEILALHRDEIIRVAEDTLRSHGCSDRVKVSYEKTAFPTKYYENLALPAGEYDALNIKIGEAKGQNWWCVLFPPLCFVDAVGGSLSEESADLLKDSLGDDNYALLTAQNGEADIPVRIEFKLLEYFGTMTAKAKDLF